MEPHESHTVEKEAELRGSVVFLILSNNTRLHFFHLPVRDPCTDTVANPSLVLTGCRQSRNNAQRVDANA